MGGSFEALLEELFEPMGGVSLRRMFGGLGIFKDGMMFGLVSDDVLYMKADEATQPAYEAEGSGPFIYDGMRGRTVSMPYWRLPERLYDEPDEFRQWAVAAFGVAERTNKKPKKPGKPTVPIKLTPRKIAAKKAAPKKSAAKPKSRKSPAKKAARKRR